MCQAESRESGQIFWTTLGNSTIWTIAFDLRLEIKSSVGERNTQGRFG